MNSSFFKFATTNSSLPRLISLISVGIIILSCGIVTIFKSYSGYYTSSIKTNKDKFSLSSVTAEAAEAVALNFEEFLESLEEFLFFLNEIGELSGLSPPFPPLLPLPPPLPPLTEPVPLT